MCFEFDARPPALPADRVLPAMAGGAAAEILTLTSSDGAEFGAAFAEAPGGEEPAIVILPDVRGLYRFYVELAERFAEAGHHAVAFDYFGRTAGNPGEREEGFDFMAHLAAATPEVVQRDLAAAIAAVKERTGAQRFVSVGFCFGGANSFIAATNPAIGLDGAVGFYGTLNAARTGLDIIPTPLDHAAQTKIPVLGLFGGGDDKIPAEDRDEFERLLGEAGVEHEVIAYPDAPHSFFDRSSEEWAEASADAWRRTLDFSARFR